MSKSKNRAVLIFKFSSWIISRIYITLFLIVERLPLIYADKLGRFLGVLLFYITKNRRKIVEDNVSTLKAWAKKRNLKNLLLDENNRTIARKIYEYNAGNFFYSFSLMNKPKALIDKYIKICNQEVLENIFRNNRGLIMLFAHAGPFELTVMLPKLMPYFFTNKNMAAMYRPFNNRYMNSWYLKRRGRFGAQLFSREDGFLKIIRHVKNGSMINIAFDIRMSQGEKIELFDKLATTSKIPHALHKATNAPVLAISFVRGDDLSWEIQFKEIASPEHGVSSEIELLKAAHEHLEKMIFENPYDYFFFQDRYK